MDQNKVEESINSIKKKYGDFQDHQELINYYERNWLKNLTSGLIYYGDQGINKNKIRSNSILEQYHASMKSRIPSHPSWEFFVQFLN